MLNSPVNLLTFTYGGWLAGYIKMAQGWSLTIMIIVPSSSSSSPSPSPKDPISCYSIECMYVRRSLHM